MTRFLERSRRFHLTATLTMFLAAVSVAHVDDYAMVSQATRFFSDVFSSSDAATEVRATPSASQSDPEHDCSCLLCTVTVSDSLRSRVLPPSSGRLAAPGAAATADSPHLAQVFHPPSA